MTTEYSRGAFEQGLTDLANLAAELEWVDNSLAALNDADISEDGARGIPAVQPREETFELGDSHPFDIKITYMGISRNSLITELDEDIPTAANTMATEWRDAELPPLQPVLATTAGEFDGIIEQLVSVHSSLVESVDTELMNVDRWLSDWQGQAADAFAYGFAAQYPIVVSSHCLMTQEIAAQVAGMKRAVAGAQQSLMNALDNAAAVLDAQLVKRQTQSFTPDTENFEATVGAASSFLASYVPGPYGKAASAGGQALKLLTDLGQPDIETAKPSEVSVGGSSASSILDDVSTTFRQIRTWLKDALDGFAENADSARHTLEGWVDADTGRQAVPPPVGLSGDVAPGDFHHVSATGYA